MSDLSNTFRVSVSQLVRVRVLFAALAFIICFAVVQSASAATFTVTNTNDSGAGSLRAAITNANNSQSDTIIFNIPTGSAGCTGSDCTITLTTGEFFLRNDAGNTLTIDGSGANRITISGNNTSRVFYISGFGASLNLINLTITGGNGTGTIAGDNGFGGGLFNNGGTVNLDSVTVSGNFVTASGGGIETTGNMNLINSTISGNTSMNSGGIQTEGGTLNLTNSTITNNSANNSTFSFAAGGVRNAGGSAVNVKNTIIAGNGHTINPDVFGSFNSQGYNLIGNTSGSTGFSSASNDILNPAGGAKLNTLNDNGGKTRTHALLSDSPAIDKGAAVTDPATNSPVNTDQRGFTRPVDLPDATYPNAPGGNGSDIGTFEVQLAPTAASASIGGRVMTASGRGIRNVYLTLTDSNGNNRLAVSTTFGYYHFKDVAAGETYIISASAKRFTFIQQSQVLNINEDTDGINFIANPIKTVSDGRKQLAGGKMRKETAW